MSVVDNQIKQIIARESRVIYATIVYDNREAALIMPIKENTENGKPYVIWKGISLIKAEELIAESWTKGFIVIIAYRREEEVPMDSEDMLVDYFLMSFY